MGRNRGDTIFSNRIGESVEPLEGVDARRAKKIPDDGKKHRVGGGETKEKTDNRVSRETIRQWLHSRKGEDSERYLEDLQMIAAQIGMTRKDTRAARLESAIANTLSSFSGAEISKRFGIQIEGVTPEPEPENSVVNTETVADPTPPAPEVKKFVPAVPGVEAQELVAGQFDYVKGVSATERRQNIGALKDHLGLPKNRRIPEENVANMAEQGLYYGYLSPEYFKSQEGGEPKPQKAIGNRSTELRNKLDTLSKSGLSDPKKQRDYLRCYTELVSLYDRNVDPDSRRKLENVLLKYGSAAEKTREEIRQRLDSYQDFTVVAPPDLPRDNEVKGYWELRRAPKSTAAEKLYATNGLIQYYKTLLARSKSSSVKDHAKHNLDQLTADTAKISDELFAFEKQGKAQSVNNAYEVEAVRRARRNDDYRAAQFNDERVQAEALAQQKRDEQLGESMTAASNRDEIEKLKVFPTRPSESQKSDKEKDLDFTRRAAQITLARVPDYKDSGVHPLHAETEAESDEKFKALTRETWKKDLVAHGILDTNPETGELVIKKKGDLDVKISLGILRMAGIHADEKNDVEYIAAGDTRPGKIHIDVGNEDGLVVKDDGRTVFMDHHGKKSRDEDSAVKYVYKTAVALGLLKPQPELDRMVAFVNDSDNLAYPPEAYGRNSYNTIVGLGRQLNFDSLYQLFKNHENPTEVIPEAELKRVYVAYEISTKKKGVIRPARTLYEVSEERRQQLEKDWEQIGKMEQQGLIIDSDDYGKVVVDINGTIKSGADTAKAYGAGVFIKWMPENNSFFISTFGQNLHHRFGQGIPVRNKMWIKARTDRSQLTERLGDVVGVVTGGKLKLEGELKKYLEAENPDIEKEMELRQMAEEALDEKYEEEMNAAGMTEEEKKEARSKPFMMGRREIAVRKLIDEFKSQL